MPHTTVYVDVLVRITTASDRGRLVSALRQTGVRIDEKQVEATFWLEYGIATFRDRKSSSSFDVIFGRSKKMDEAGSILGLPTFFRRRKI